MSNILICGDHMTKWAIFKFVETTWLPSNIQNGGENLTTWAVFKMVKTTWLPE